MSHTQSPLTRLTPQKLALLQLIYKYRFVTADLLAESIGLKSGKYLYRRLDLLLDEDYIGKRFDASYRLLGKPAAYYLRPKGLRLLCKQLDADNRPADIEKILYHDASVSDGLVQQELTLYKLAQHLECVYKPRLKYFTKREMKGYSYFPTILPDGLLSFKGDAEYRSHRVFLYYIGTHMPSHAIKRRFATITEFFDSGGWDVTKSPRPAILFVGETLLAERRTRQIFATFQDNFEVYDPLFYAATLTTLQYSTKGNDTRFLDHLQLL